MGIRQSTQESGDLGVLESQVGGAAQFGRRSDMRFAARKAFVHEDCSRRSRAAVLRKAAPIHTSYQVGDIVVYTDSIAKQERTRLGHQQPESSDSKTRQLGGSTKGFQSLLHSRD